MNRGLDEQARERQDLIRRLETHRVYATVWDLASLRVFLEHHVACVLDFMSLLKRLQVELTRVETPWVPSADPLAARFVNSIVLDEEADAAFGPEPASHYAWYLAAMEEAGANVGPIRELEARLRAGRDPLVALSRCGLPPAAEAFTRTTFELASGPLHEVAAAFVHGRESVIPGMFVHLVRELRDSGLPCGLFVRYLERHVEVDAEDHGPTARRMMERILAGNGELRLEARRLEAHGAALRALKARGRLWDETALACEAASRRREGELAR